MSTCTPMMMRARAPARDDEGGDPPEGLADYRARGCGAVPPRVRPRPHLPRRRAGSAAPARGGGVATRALREVQRRRVAAAARVLLRFRVEVILYVRVAP